MGTCEAGAPRTGGIMELSLGLGVCGGGGRGPAGAATTLHHTV